MEVTTKAVCGCLPMTACDRANYAMHRMPISNISEDTAAHRLILGTRVHTLVGCRSVGTRGVGYLMIQVA